MFHTLTATAILVQVALTVIALILALMHIAKKDRPKNSNRYLFWVGVLCVIAASMFFVIAILHNFK